MSIAYSYIYDVFKDPAGTKLQIPFYFHLTRSPREKLIFQSPYRLFPYPFVIYSHNHNNQEGGANYPTTKYQPHNYDKKIKQDPRIKDPEEDG